MGGGGGGRGGRKEVEGKQGIIYSRAVVLADHADCDYQELLRACVSLCMCAGCEREKQEKGEW